MPRPITRRTPARVQPTLLVTIAFDLAIIALVSLTRDPWLLCLASVLAIGDAVAGHEDGSL